MSRGRGQRSLGTAGAATRPPAASATSTVLSDLRAALDEADARDGSAYSPFTLTWIVERPLRDALAAGDWELARAVACEYHSRRGDADMVAEVRKAPIQGFQDVSRLLRMESHMRRDPYVATGSRTMPYRHDQYLKDLIGDCHRTPEGFSMLLFHARTAQERRLEWKHPQSEIELCEHTHETTESALRAARRLLAVSDWKGPLRVTSTLSEEAFWKFCESQQGDPAYRGLEVGASWSGRVCIVAAKEMTIDGRRIRLQMAHEIVPGGPKTKEKDPVGIANLWAGARPERGLRPIHFTDDAIRVEELEVAARWKEGNERSGLPARSSASVFGSAACAHARSRWLSDTQEAWLRCDDCFDGAVARVPMHQVPEDHDAHRPIHPDMSYLSERNFWNAVNDLPNDSGVDLAALRARDGIASMDPADYATPEQEHLFAVRPGLGVSSVSAAMNRR